MHIHQTQHYPAPNRIQPGRLGGHPRAVKVKVTQRARVEQKTTTAAQTVLRGLKISMVEHMTTTAVQTILKNSMVEQMTPTEL